MNETNDQKYHGLEFQVIAKDVIDAMYPRQKETYTKLNEKGDKLLELEFASSYDRYRLDENSKDASWRTFRDCDPSKY